MNPETWPSHDESNDGKISLASSTATSAPHQHPSRFQNQMDARDDNREDSPTMMETHIGADIIMPPRNSMVDAIKDSSSPLRSLNVDKREQLLTKRLRPDMVTSPEPGEIVETSKVAPSMDQQMDEQDVPSEKQPPEIALVSQQDTGMDHTRLAVASAKYSDEIEDQRIRVPDWVPNLWKFKGTYESSHEMYYAFAV
jgi:hypothetical protein